MIKRVWRGWTTPGNAAAYQELLLTRIIPGIEAKAIDGFLGIEVLREDLGEDSGEDLGGEVEFSTVMTFASLDSVIAFQGPDYARAYVPDAAQAVLSRWDQRSRHYEVVEERRYG